MAVNFHTLVHSKIEEHCPFLGGGGFIFGQGIDFFFGGGGVYLTPICFAQIF